MGNLTPRILRCINELNVAMGATGPNASRRRVHHNAESHRNHAFGALTQADMTTVKEGESYGDGLPLTVFQHRSLYQDAGHLKPSAHYGDVCIAGRPSGLQGLRGCVEGVGVPRAEELDLGRLTTARGVAHREMTAPGPVIG